jgi:hypothetical protein
MASGIWRVSAALLAAASLAAGCGQAGQSTRTAGSDQRATSTKSAGSTQNARSTNTSRSGLAAAGRLFAPDSVWNAPLAADAPIDPSSSRLINWLGAEVRREFAQGPAPDVESVSDSTPIYTVPRNQPTVPVALDNNAPWGRSLAQAFRSVPIPPDARPAAGSDAHMTIWQPSTDRLWEFWEARHTASGWRAAWGGAMEHVSRSPGYYTGQSWPGAKTYWGSTATSLPVAGGTMLISELEAGRIDHALAIALPAARAGVYAWPAQRTDGTDPDPNSIPEGARLRLDPHLDVAKLHLPPVVETMALAAQRYGMIVRDKTGEAVAFYAQAPTDGNDPYPRIFGGIQPYDFLKYFPWANLEVVRMQLRRGTGAP